MTWRHRFPLAALLLVAWKYGEHAQAGRVIQLCQDIARGGYPWAPINRHRAEQYLRSARDRRLGRCA